MHQTRLDGEPGDYRAAREQLLRAEVDLIDQRERVAQMRRALPLGPVVTDYELLEGPADLDAGDEPVRSVRLSELFSAPDRPLVIYYFMYGKAQTSPCPMCTMWIDGFNGVARHVTQNIDLAIVAAADLPALRAARTRPGLVAAAPAERGRQLVQAGLRQRGRARRPGGHRVGVHPRRHGLGPSSLHDAPVGQRRAARARDRPAVCHLEPARSHARGPGGLVLVAHVRLTARPVRVLMPLPDRDVDVTEVAVPWRLHAYRFARRFRAVLEAP